eukprot:TRINITY_DN18229_c0_g1_i1.p2 TRINITY_DN18229_c0_g1~~TRINITY_DN18229_c0_g1_i1.p2  ORF type:complete len:325 (+),score=137.51 TRINITY_DN18229_c0_g1_i1:24-998(+)
MKLSAALLCALALVAVCAAEPLLHMRLSSDDNAVVTCTLTNTHDAPISFLAYHTPFEKHVLHNLFEVLDTATESEVPYTGAVARRVFPPARESLVRVLPGDTITRSIDLSRYYALQEGAEYRVQLRIAPYFQRYASGPLSLGKATHMRVHTLTPTPQRVQPDTTYKNCDGSQQAVIPPAASGALQNANRAFSCVAGGGCNRTIAMWFGQQPALDYLTRVYNNLSTYISQDKFRYYCNADECQIGVYAYVYPTDPTSTVHLCNTFFRIADEQVNTIVHETSHFAFNQPGTLDVEYGQPACLELARTAPLKASHNADNVCYFAADA